MQSGITLPNFRDPDIPFTADETPQARYDRLEEVWKSHRGKWRNRWRGWEPFLALHSFYHFHLMAFLDERKQQKVEDRHWDLACFYEDTINILEYQFAAEVPPEIERRLRRMAFTPRFTHKSTWLRSLMEWLLLHNPQLRILYAKETKADAKEVIQKIARDFEHNAFLRQYFPEYMVGGIDDETGKPVKKPAPWGKEGMLLPIAIGMQSGVETEPNLSPGGVDVTETGQHYHLFCPDDMLTANNSKSVTGRENVRRMLSEMLAVMGPYGPWTGCGTFWTMDDVHTEMAGLSEEYAHSALKCHIYREQASTVYGAEGEPNYPKLLPMRYLRQMRSTMGPAMYACLFDMYPAGAGDRTFDMAYTRYFKWEDLVKRSQPMAFHCIIDTAATSKLSSDKTAILIVALSNDRPQNIYQVTLHCKRFTKSDVIRIITETWDYWHAHPLCHCLTFWMQTVTFEGIYKTLIETYVRPHCQAKGEGFAIQQLKRNTTIKKFMEIGALQPFHFRGQVLLRLKDDVSLLDCNMGDHEVMYPKLRPDAQILFRQMRDHIQDEGHQDDDAIDTLAQIPKILQQSSRYTPPKKKRPDTPRDREMQRRMDRFGVYEDFEERRQAGEYEGKDIQEAILEYNMQYGHDILEDEPEEVMEV